MVVFLAIKLFCMENVSIRKFEAMDDEADASTNTGNEIFFIHAVTVGKCVSVQKDIPQDNSPT